MKKVLVIAQTDIDNETGGVWKKINSQIAALQTMFGKVTFIGYKREKIVVREYQQGEFEDNIISDDHVLPRKISLWLSSISYLKDHRFDYAYIRYPVIDMFVLKAFSRLYNEGTKIIMEVPTFPLETQHAKGALKVAYFFDHYLHNQCSKYVSKILYIGNNTDKIFGCIAQQIPNGISAVDSESITGFGQNDTVIQMIGVSTMRPWHGYERIIKGLGNYYSEGQENKHNIRLLLVGDGPEKKTYESLVSQYSIEDHVIFAGKLGGENLTLAYEGSTIGIGSLGLYKNNMFVGSTLKTHEYLLRGLPFVYGCEEINLPKDYPYAYLVDNGPEPVCISDIIDFIKPLLKNHSRISEEMHEFAIERFSWVNIFQNALHDI